MTDLQTLKRFIETVALCLVIASLQALLRPQIAIEVLLVYSLAIGLTTLLVIELGRRLFRLNPETGWPRGWVGPALVLVACSTGFLAGSSLAASWFGHPALWRQDPVVLKTSLVITALAGVGASIYFYQKGRNAWLSAAKEASDRLAAQAQLQRLSAQLQPHMLFNTLANVRALIATRPEMAVAMLDRLNTLLRTSLKAGRVPVHSMAEEFAALEDYLALMHIRIGDRLQFQVQLPDSLRDQSLPSLLAQPLVENAILHGIESSVLGGSVWITAYETDHLLQLDVINSGQPLVGEPPEKGHGVGLRLVRERMQQQWGPLASLTLDTVTIDGQDRTRASLRWPRKSET
jgi:signal transduction histidine kinase